MLNINDNDGLNYFSQGHLADAQACTHCFIELLDNMQAIDNMNLISSYLQVNNKPMANQSEEKSKVD